MNTPKIAERTLLKDGTSLSIQASRIHYCTPRIDGAVKYDSVEVGFPTDKDGIPIRMSEAWKEYEDGPESQVFGYVPVELVEAFVNEHGGREEE